MKERVYLELSRMFEAHILNRPTLIVVSCTFMPLLEYQKQT